MIKYQTSRLVCYTNSPQNFLTLRQGLLDGIQHTGSQPLSTES